MAQTNLSELLFEQISLKDGLPNTQVQAIAQDRNGFIWLGTQNGLARYDGNICRPQTWQSTSPENFHAKNVRCLLVDREGTLWVGTHSEGLGVRRADDGIFKNANREPAFEKLGSASIRAIFEDSKNRVWIVAAGRGIWVFENGSKTARQIPNPEIANLAEDPKTGEIWAFGDAFELFRFSENQFNFEKMAAPDGMKKLLPTARTSLKIDEKSTIWVGAQGLGLHSFTPREKVWQHFRERNNDLGPTCDNVYDIEILPDGQMLLATDGGGLNLFDSKTGRFTARRAEADNPGGLGSDALQTLFFDQQKNLWVCTVTGGVFVHKNRRKSIEVFPRAAQRVGVPSHRSVLKVLQLPENQTLVGTDGGGLYFFEEKNGHFLSAVKNADGRGKVVKSIFKDSKNRVWLGHYGDGMSLFNPKTGQIERRWLPENGFPSANIWAFSEGADGQLWLAFNDRGVGRFDPETGKVQVFEPRDGLPSSEVVCILADRRGRVWAGSENNGLALIQPGLPGIQLFQQRPDDISALGSNAIRCVFEDSKGRVWVGTDGGGLHFFEEETGKFRQLPPENGLPPIVISIDEKPDGSLWVASFSEVVQFHPYKIGVPPLKIDFRQGALANQFNPMAMLCDAAANKLFIGGISGICAINLATIGAGQEQPRTVLSDFRVGNLAIAPGAQPASGRVFFDKPLEETEEIQLDHADRSFAIELAAIGAADGAQFSYRLDGFDVAWTEIPIGQRTATYTNLPPGTHVFRAKCKLIGGDWGEERRVKILVRPPFWQEAWFMGLAAILAGCLIWLALRFYTRQRESDLRQRILENEKEILRLKNEQLAHEIQDKEAELISTTVKVAHKNEILESVKGQLLSLRQIGDEEEKSRTLRSLSRSLETELKSADEAWALFMHHFDLPNQNFTQKIWQKHPNLTQGDLRLCVLTRMNINSKEIATLLNITVRGVEQARHRLRKRLGLREEESLFAYLGGF